MNWDVNYYPEYWNGIKLAYPDVPKEHPKFAQSISVGNLVFVSGCVGQDTNTGAQPPASVADQVNLALEQARSALETAGSSMANIVKTFFLITNLDDYAEVRKTETEYYEKFAPLLIEKPPAATLMVVPSLAKPEFLAEYEVTAAIDRSAKDWTVEYYPEYWGGKELAYPHVPKDHAKFARTQAVGNLVIVSGCQALDHDTVKVEEFDFARQTEIVLDKIKIGMEETGGSLGSVAKTNVFIKDLNELSLYREIEQAYYQKHVPDIGDDMPASTAFIVKELPRPEFVVEVEAFGLINKAKPDFSAEFYQGNQFASQSVRAGNLLFLSGCDGNGKNNVEAQIITALDKIRNGMEQASSSLNNLIKTTMMLKNLSDYPMMRKTEVEYYQTHAPQLVEKPPVCTFIELPEISGKDTLFQMDAIGLTQI